jgi:hypothetical protein
MHPDDERRALDPRDDHLAADEPVLDIGGEIGALILRTGPEYLDREIEVSPIGDDAGRVHTAIHRRSVGDLIIYAGLFPELRAGEYRVWTDDPRLPDRVTIVGGAVSELDWTIEPEGEGVDPEGEGTDP